MRLKLSAGSLVVLFVVISFTIVATFLAFQPKEVKGNIYECQGNFVPFRANISDCLAVEVSPSETELTELILSPLSKGVLILVEPNGSSGLGVSAYEIYKTFTSLGIKTGVVYTEHWPSQPNVPNMSIEDATYTMPIIWLRLNDSETLIELDGPKVLVHAENQYALDSASCKISILAINEVYEC